MKRKRIVILFVALVLGVLALSILLGWVRSGLVSGKRQTERQAHESVSQREKEQG